MVNRTLDAPPVDAAAALIFARGRTTRADQLVFLGKLVIALLLCAAGVWLASSGTPLLVVAGVLLLGAMYTHLVELQHQCLHHSALVKAAHHRRVGFLLGVPMLVSFSHYRVRHLLHHRYLGTDQDTEFFGFDTRKPLTWSVLLRGLFDYKRLVDVVADMARSWRGGAEYDVSERGNRHVVAEYRVLSVVVAAVATACAFGYWEQVVLLWAAPLLLVSTPLHFLVELPEHIYCDDDTRDVLRNTRTITGSWLSRWYTNGNNLHVEHHAAMAVPINRLPERHAAALAAAKHTNRSYWEFYRGVIRQVRKERS